MMIFFPPLVLVAVRKIPVFMNFVTNLIKIGKHLHFLRMEMKYSVSYVGLVGVWGKMTQSKTHFYMGSY
jgi:hypothetical protein